MSDKGWYYTYIAMIIVLIIMSMIPLIVGDWAGFLIIWLLIWLCFHSAAELKNKMK